jgi:hypothetical protein
MLGGARDGRPDDWAATCAVRCKIERLRGRKMRGADPLFELMLKEAGSVTNLPSTDVYTIEDAAAISDAYFETVELERRMVTGLRSAGVTIRSMSKADYIAWLQLAQRTAWVKYTRINPRPPELLFKTVRTFLVRLGDKHALVDSIFGFEQK